jgi:hypothetical protein
MHIRGLMLGVIVATALAGPAFAADEAKQGSAECRKAEVNPVTGHVLCVEPLGAAVEAPPSDALSPCQKLKHTGDFTYAPNCKDTPSG